MDMNRLTDKAIVMKAIHDMLTSLAATISPDQVKKAFDTIAADDKAITRKRCERLAAKANETLAELLDRRFTPYLKRHGLVEDAPVEEKAA